MGTPITIDELAQKAGVSPVSLLERDMCTDEDLLALARFCDSWKLTGHYLKLSERELSAVDEENKTVELKRVGILKKWRRKKAFYATYRAFIDVFLEQGDALTAYKICQEFQKHYCQSEAQSASQPSPSLAQSDSGYGSQLNLLSQQSGAAIADEDADTASYKLTPQLSVEPPKDGHFNDSTQNLLSATDKGVDEMDSNPPINDQSASSPPLRSVDPLFPPTDDPQILRERDRILSDALKTFKLKSFLPNQESTIRNILSGTSTLLIQRVGFGKSLCYQLPAYLYSQSESRAPCITLVISPLISLMEDQMRNCPTNLSMKCLHSNQTKQQRDEVLHKVADGKISVLLLSPEELEGGSFCDESGIPHLLGQLPPVAFVCIDEVHCISEWSHNFRPSYFRIEKILRESLNIKCILGLTATATHATALSVAKHLRIKDIITGDTILPNNLHISVSQVKSDERDEALIQLLQSTKFQEFESIIIYCTTKRQTNTVAKMLSDHFETIPRNDVNESNQDEVDLRLPGITKRKKSQNGGSLKRQKMDWCVASYHADIPPLERKRVQDEFMSGRVHIVVATVAFGMGLNKKDVRAIIHYNMPQSIELFVQEIGRAGRDGLPAYCHVFIDEERNDLYLIRRFAYKNAVDSSTLRQFVEKIFSSSSCLQSPDLLLSQSSKSSTEESVGQKITISSEEMEKLDINEDCTATLLCYLELEGWLEITNAVHDICTIKWGDQSEWLKSLENGCLVVAVAAAELRKSCNLDYSTEMKFSMSKVAKHMTKKFDKVYSELRGLKHNDQTKNEQGENEAKNAISVNFSHRIFYVQSSGDCSSEKCHKFLQEMVTKREDREVMKTHLLHAILWSALSQNCHPDTDNTLVNHSTLGQLIDQYFSTHGLSVAYLRKRNISVVPPVPDTPPELEEKVKKEIGALLTLCKDARFTGTTIARIFYGLESLCFPAKTWKKQRRFWWKHVRMDFNKIRGIATNKLQ